MRDLCGEKEQMVISHIGTAIKNFIANARYRFVSEDGPKLGKVTLKEPLMHKWVCFNYMVILLSYFD